mmetsp:Transcript_26054/g.41399  ORF Transcript_26054/g.41399 Transcript_26054/m.41399 type:complete len:208 (-) Transcript_26054:65-688(-)
MGEEKSSSACVQPPSTEECHEGTEASLQPTPALKLSSSKKRPREERCVTWDEEGIAEHDKTRGTRMKIEEPKTPWASSPVSEDEEECVAPMPSPERGGVCFSAIPGKAADPTEIAAKLAQVAADRDAASPSPPASPPRNEDLETNPSALAESDDRRVLFADSRDTDSRQPSANFLAKRRQHYDEFKVLMARRAQQASADSDSDAKSN